MIRKYRFFQKCKTNLLQGNVQLHKYNRTGELFMMMTETWWESIFSGALAHGINEDKMHLLQDEAFLYLSVTHQEEQTKVEPLDLN